MERKFHPKELSDLRVLRRELEELSRTHFEEVSGELIAGFIKQINSKINE